MQRLVCASVCVIHTFSVLFNSTMPVSHQFTTNKQLMFLIASSSNFTELCYWPILIQAKITTRHTASTIHSIDILCSTVFTFSGTNCLPWQWFLTATVQVIPVLCSMLFLTVIPQFIPWVVEELFETTQVKTGFPTNGTLEWGRWFQITCFDQEENIYLY